MPEARRSGQFRALLGAKIIFTNRMSVIDCAIKNISATDVLTFPQSNIGKSKGKLGSFMVLPASPIVMIADDNPLIVESYKDVVTNAGFIFGGSFLSCKSAEEWLSVHYPDAAILDVMLQDGSSAGAREKAVRPRNSISRRFWLFGRIGGDR